MNDNQQNTNYVIYDKIIKPSEAAPRFDFIEPITGPANLSNSLQMTCHKNGWFGLSAPQVGINTRVFYLLGFESAMFNPIIVDTSDSEVYLEEVSPSYPELVINIKRPELIRVRWTNAMGETQTDIYSGFTARVIQRKIDFLDGIDILSRATKYHRDKALKSKKSEVQINTSILETLRKTNPTDVAKSLIDINNKVKEKNNED